MKDLLEIRQEIDKVDSEIAKLYEKRMEIAGEVAEYKIANGKKVFDREREKAKLEKIKAYAHNDFNRKGLTELFEQIMSMSRKFQYKKMNENNPSGKLSFFPIDALDSENIKVVYQGVEGAYSQIATRSLFGKNSTISNVATFRDAMEAIEEGVCDYAVLPIENSTAGMVTDIYDLLVEFENYIVGEKILKIEHALLGVPGACLSDIKRVYSHPQGLMQCQKFLSEHRQIEQISMANTAMAAQKILKDNDATQAAIASTYAGELYGLEVLKEKINFESNNSTRFIVVTNQKVFLKDADKISICFEIDNTSGSLYHILSHFIYNDLNMIKIESRPLEGRPWEYKFFIDFEGNIKDSSVRNALCGLRGEARNMKVLGNYKSLDEKEN
ncbi:chorismate mutase [Acetitomaculum ruminis DSM 5522]|uniref:Bifunctional chorismate mutase/prephenate dehydratase n=1 Tax=Acetitomaculum ruminis DSM 5522 TaxID=1120918 RepID=A0A1I0XTG5_9FIRM|nr:prephenate dehydratase [Acetitomaculum ruminis]SFB03957.1 chorismate mutase [Acetitomaculum ruminis DSM 5522]